MSKNKPITIELYIIFRCCISLSSYILEVKNELWEGIKKKEYTYIHGT